ncbi:hypothetical protein CU098_007418 [Rhizopus stolonifer]|uniref:Uncharacterized protein n=1 Tax=Rhizopus stolonifer TaxID=4846 RepID=A0A367J4D7_RHIST|nr:hypothetical protein CU098_007418 [Rhizopus stolonifer]
MSNELKIDTHPAKGSPFRETIVVLVTFILVFKSLEYNLRIPQASIVGVLDCRLSQHSTELQFQKPKTCFREELS